MKQYTYYVTAGNNSTDLGCVGRANTLLAAKRIGRKAVRNSLPNGQGSYRIWADYGDRQVGGGTCDIRTGSRWVD